MTVYRLSHIQCVELYQNLQKVYDRVIDQKKIWILQGYEEAINEYTIDTVVQLIERTEDGISLNCLFAEPYYQQQFESMIKALTH